jgi:hypothetical protein
MAQFNFIVSTPFTGYGILIAVDILTSAQARLLNCRPYSNSSAVAAKL